MPTLTAFPVGGAVAPCDGPINRVNVDESFATIIGASGNQGGLESTSNDRYASVDSSTTTNQFAQIHRGFFNFDTSSIGAGQTISSATFSLWFNFKNNGLGSDDFHLCSATHSSYASLPSGDYANVGSTSFGSIAYASINTAGAYNDITMNASGIAFISTSGTTALATRNFWDLNASFTGTWASGANTRFEGFYADQTGTANDPKLVVVYSAAAAGGSSYLTTLGAG